MITSSATSTTWKSHLALTTLSLSVSCVDRPLNEEYIVVHTFYAVPIFTFLTLHAIDTKKSLSDTEVEREVNEFLQEKTDEQRDKALQQALDKIMIAHRNTKLFLFLMSGPFLIMMLFVKYTFKILILYLLYK
jgi:hypothetical protein